jgi:hypothetical protein
METTDTNEEYTAKDFGKDVAVSVAVGVGEVVAAYAILLGIGYTYTKVMDFRERRAAKKTQTEE